MYKQAIYKAYIPPFTTNWIRGSPPTWIAVDHLLWMVKMKKYRHTLDALGVFALTFWDAKFCQVCPPNVKDIHAVVLVYPWHLSIEMCENALGKGPFCHMSLLYSNYLVTFWRFFGTISNWRLTSDASRPLTLVASEGKFCFGIPRVKM